MTFAFAILLLVILAAVAGASVVWGAPVLAIPVVLLCAAGAVFVRVLYVRTRAARLELLEREREGVVQFSDEDYETLARRPEHTHGDVKRGPTKPRDVTP